MCTRSQKTMAATKALAMAQCDGVRASDLRIDHLKSGCWTASEPVGADWINTWLGGRSVALLLQPYALLILARSFSRHAKLFSKKSFIFYALMITAREIL